MVAHHFGRVFIARAGEPARFRWPDVEPHAGGGGERQDACTYAILIHGLDHLTAGPGDLTGEVRLLACVFVIKPEFLIFGRIKMKVGRPLRQSLSACCWMLMAIGLIYRLEKERR